jgi:hypothetical protein
LKRNTGKKKLSKPNKNSIESLSNRMEPVENIVAVIKDKVDKVTNNDKKY